MESEEMRYVQWPSLGYPIPPPAQLAQSPALRKKVGCGSPRWPRRLTTTNPVVHGN